MGLGAGVPVACKVGLGTEVSSLEVQEQHLSQVLAAYLQYLGPEFTTLNISLPQVAEENRGR